MQTKLQLFSRTQKNNCLYQDPISISMSLEHLGLVDGRQGKLRLVMYHRIFWPNQSPKKVTNRKRMARYLCTYKCAYREGTARGICPPFISPRVTWHTILYLGMLHSAVGQTYFQSILWSSWGFLHQSNVFLSVWEMYFMIWMWSDPAAPKTTEVFCPKMRTLSQIDKVEWMEHWVW